MASEQVILIKFQTACDYYHNRCKEIRNDIIALHQKGYKFTQLFLSRYIHYLINGTHYTYYKCINCQDSWKQPLTELFTYLTPADNELHLLSSIHTYNSDTTCLFNVLVERGVNIPNVCLTNAFTYQNIQLATLLCSYLPMSVQNLEIACQFGNETAVDTLLNQKIMPTPQCLTFAIKSGNANIIDLLINSGVNPDKTCLLEACRSNNVNIVKTLLNSKIVPDRSCFNAAIEKGYLHNDSEYSYAANVASIVDALIEYGYIPDYDDVVEALKHGCRINNIGRFNIALGEQFLELCSAYNYYPYKLSVKATMQCLQNACNKSGNMKTIRHLITSGLVPDTTCLQNACKFRNNLQVIKLLTSKGAKVDLICIKNLATVVGNAAMIFAVNTLINQEQEAAPLNEAVELLANVDNDIDNEPQPQPQEEAEIVVNKKGKVMKGKKGKKAKIVKAVKAEVVEKIEGEDSDEMPVEDPLIASAKTSTTEKTELTELSSEAEAEKETKTAGGKTEETPTQENSVSEKREVVKVIPPEKQEGWTQKNKYKLAKLATTVFELDGDSYNFLELRKKILEYFKNRGLYDSTDKQYIRINEELAELFDYKEDQYLHFNDVDKLVLKTYSVTKTESKMRTAVEESKAKTKAKTKAKAKTKTKTQKVKKTTMAEKGADNL